MTLPYESATNILAKGFAFLEAIGYLPPVVTINDDQLLGKYLSFVYNLKSGLRSIKVHYVAKNSDRNAIVSLYISDDDNRMFSLDDWLSVNSIEGAMKLSGSDENNFLVAFCEEARRFLEVPLRDVVSGKIWIDVPFDWKGYR